MTTHSKIDKQIAKGELNKYGIGKQAPAPNPKQDELGLDIPDFLRREPKPSTTRVIDRRLYQAVPKNQDWRSRKEKMKDSEGISFTRISPFEDQISDEDLSLIAKRVQTLLGDQLEAYNIIYKDGKAAGLLHEIIKGFIVNECKHLDDKVYRYIVKGD